MIAQALDLLIAGLIVLGALGALIGAYGLATLPDFFKRIHAPSVIATLGVGCVLIASVLYFAFVAKKPSASALSFAPPMALLIALFMGVTTPVAAQMLIQAVMKRHAMRDATQDATRDTAGAETSPRD